MNVSLERFWNEVRRGASFYPGGHTPDAPRLDSTAVECGLRSKTDWVSPYSVTGYDEAEFALLSPPERTRLTAAVTNFRAAVRPRNPFRPEPPTVAEMEAVLPYFRDILLLLEFHRFRDAEAFRIGKTVESEIAPFRPPELTELRFHTGYVSTGDLALWIWGFVSGACPRRPEGWADTTYLDRGLSEVARRVAPELYPFISFRDLCPPAQPVKSSSRRKVKIRAT